MSSERLSLAKQLLNPRTFERVITEMVEDWPRFKARYSNHIERLIQETTTADKETILELRHKAKRIYEQLRGKVFDHGILEKDRAKTGNVIVKKYAKPNTVELVNGARVK